ncbi:hypothetical protein L0F63_006822, partial [Massospora cicadina]
DTETLDTLVSCVPVTGVASSNTNTTEKESMFEPMRAFFSEKTLKESTSPKKDEGTSEAPAIPLSSPNVIKDFTTLDIAAVLETSSESKVEAEAISDGAVAQEKKADRPRPLSSGLLDWHCLRYSPGLLDSKFLASFLESSGNLPPPTKNQLTNLLNTIKGEVPDLVIHIDSSQSGSQLPLLESDEQKFNAAMGPQPASWAAYPGQTPTNASYLNWTSNIPLETIPSWKQNMFASPPTQSNHLWPQNAFPSELFDRGIPKQPSQKQPYFKNTLAPHYNPKVPASRLMLNTDPTRTRKADSSKRDTKVAMPVFQQNTRTNQLSSSLVPQGTKSAWNSVGEKKKKGANGTESSTTAMRLSEALALIEGGQLEGRFACNGLGLPEVCPYPGCGFLINNDFEKLQTHVASHNPNRPFECSECPSSFHRGQDLVRHRRIHLQLRPYKCPNCSKAFGRRDAQQRHTNRLNCAATNSAGFGNELNSTQT